MLDEYDYRQQRSRGRRKLTREAQVTLGIIGGTVLIVLNIVQVYFGLAGH